MSGEQNNAMFQMLRDIHQGQIDQATALGRIEGHLAGQDERVKKLEDSSTRNFWMTYVITPAFVLAHTALKALGVIKV